MGINCPGLLPRAEALGGSLYSDRAGEAAWSLSLLQAVDQITRSTFSLKFLELHVMGFYMSLGQI